MQTLLRHRRFDVDEYHRMGRAGILCEEDRVELLDGEIVEMTPVGSRHAACVARLTRLLVPALSDRALVWSQNPLRLDRHSEPEPDLALLRPRPDDYATGHPEPDDALLVVEVADSSLESDRLIKMSLYAKAGIPELWIVDLTNDTIEVHREPIAGSYESHARHSTGSVAPLAFPDVQVDVGDIVPSRA